MKSAYILLNLTKKKGENMRKILIAAIIFLAACSQQKEFIKVEPDKQVLLCQDMEKKWVGKTERELFDAMGEEGVEMEVKEGFVRVFNWSRRHPEHSEGAVIYVYFKIDSLGEIRDVRCSKYDVEEE